MKHFYLIVFITFFVNYAFAQGITRNGKITTNGSEYVNENGAIGSTDGVNKNGEIVAAITPLQIGDDYEGGKVAYIFESGDPGYVQGEVHGLIANLNDLTAGWWGATNYPVTGTSASIGSGNANTVKIVNVNGSIGAAAYSCSNLTSGGKSDWYLPSSQEAAKLYLNKTVLGLSDAAYWTSTQFDTQYAYSIHMQTGVVSNNYKAINYRVRPVRTF
jgi:hypothetical protein